MGYLGGDRPQHVQRGRGFGTHAIIAEGIRRVDGWANTSSSAHMAKIAMIVVLFGPGRYL
jgi:hypothetical protein